MPKFQFHTASYKIIVLRKMGLFGGESCPVAERIARRGFYIPSGVALTREQAVEVSQVLQQVLT